MRVIRLADQDGEAAAALESEYRRAVRRWYPSSWTEAHGEALVGTLMDAAEAQARSRIGVRTSIDLAWRGSAVRASSALRLEVRILAASLGVGVVLGYAVVLVLTDQSAFRTEVLSGASGFFDLEAGHLLALAPFFVAWLVVVGLSFGPRRSLAVGITAASAVTITFSSAWFFDSIADLFAHGWSSWWQSLTFFFPGSVANLVLLLSASGIALLARPRPVVALGAAVVTVLVAALSLILRTGRLITMWPDWFWTRTWDLSGVALSIPVLLPLLAVAAVVLDRTGRPTWGLALGSAGVPVLLGWTAEIIVNPQVIIAL